MQLGPATTDNSIQAVSQDDSISSDQPVLDQDSTSNSDSESDHQTQPGSPTDTQDNPQTIQESSGESFFQTMFKDQEMPTSSAMLMVAGVVLAFLIIMRSLIKSSAKRKQQTRTMGDTAERIDTIRERARGSMEPARQAMVDAEELTRRMGAVLDNKATKIELLLEEATERIAQLERANRDLRVQQSMSQPISQASPKAETIADQNSQQELSNQGYRQAEPAHQDERSMTPEALDRARLDQDRAERTWVEADAPAKNESEEPIFRIDRGISAKPRQESPHPLTFPEQVDELATQGFNALEIANKLNRLVGEVELVLNLRRNSG